MTLDSNRHAQAPVTEAPEMSGADPDDSGYGWVMFAAFISAVLAITFAVCALALAPSWWVLAVVYALDLGVTAAVFTVVLGALGTDSYPDLKSAGQPYSDVPAAQRRASLEVRGASLAVDH